MNNILLSSKKKVINNLDEILLDFEKNIRNSGHHLQWLNSEVNNKSLKIKEKKVFYIIEGNIILFFDDTFSNIDKSFIITPRNILSTINDFYELTNFTEYPSNFQIINLNTIKTKLTLYFSIQSNELKLLKDTKLRKILYCIDCELCKNVCPISNIIPDFYPINDIIRQFEEKGVIHEKLCTSCKACEQICPVNIKMSEYLLNLQFKKDKSITERIIMLINKNKSYHKKTSNYINNRLKL